VLSLPEDNPQPGRRRPPGVVLLNSGILHRTGASRIHVALARRLAQAGYPSLRMDFSGIGDSQPRRDDLRFEESAPLEVREALDRMEALAGCEAFVLFGLCSGADVAIQVAPLDRRVTGIVHLDAVAYRTPQWYLRHYGPRAMRLGPWIRFAHRRVRALGVRSSEAAAETPDAEVQQIPTYVREFPPHAEFERMLAALAARRVQQLFLYTSGMESRINHPGQFARSFPRVDFGDTLRVEHWPDADHIFRGRHHQHRLFDTVVEWMGERFPLSDAAPAATYGRAA
jgi:alpha/beta superfamily hydrolase